MVRKGQLKAHSPMSKASSYSITKYIFSYKGRKTANNELLKRESLMWGASINYVEKQRGGGVSKMSTNLHKLM